MRRMYATEQTRWGNSGSINRRHLFLAIDMTRTVTAGRQGSEFDNFLYAVIGEDRHGMLLSVLSALARQNIDPWQEAAKLARLPIKIATCELALLIAALPSGASLCPEPTTTADRLIALLPRGMVSNNPDGNANAVEKMLAPAKSPAFVPIVAWIALMLLLVVSELLISKHQAAVGVPAPKAPASAGAVAPQTPPAASIKRHDEN